MKRNRSIGLDLLVCQEFRDLWRIGLIQIETPEIPREQRPILTPKALTVGILVVVAVNLLAPFSEWIVRSTLLTTNYFPLGVGGVVHFCGCGFKPGFEGP